MKSFAVCLLAFLMALPSHAFIKQRLDVSVQPEALLKKANQPSMGLGISPKETLMKADLKKLAKTKKGRFEDQLDFFGNPYLAEVKGDLKQIEKGKVIARMQFYDAVHADWRFLRNSAMNEGALDSFDHFSATLKEQLREMSYVPTDDKTWMTFRWKWGTALVSKDLKKVRWRLEVSYQLDDNYVSE